MDNVEISVVVPTYNPDPLRFERTLKAICAQQLNSSLWECIVVDNNSIEPVVLPAFCAHKSFHLVHEQEQGLSAARHRGIQESSAEIIVFVDDDNALSSDYLSEAVTFMGLHPLVGIVGGKSLPEYEVEPPDWFFEGIAPLGCRDMGEDTVTKMWSDSNEREYPTCSPIGAGMVFRKVSVTSWSESLGKTGITDRKGDSLSSAGDCDMVLHALSEGWSVAYEPKLRLTHLISQQRLTQDYLARVSRCAYRDFVKVLSYHEAGPWSPIPKWTLGLRSIKAWFKTRAWAGPRNWILWQSSIGQFEGRASIRDLKR